MSSAAWSAISVAAALLDQRARVPGQLRRAHRAAADREQLVRRRRRSRSTLVASGSLPLDPAQRGADRILRRRLGRGAELGLHLGAQPAQADVGLPADATSSTRFLYWTKPQSSAMPHASSTTPPNDSISLLRSDSDGAMLRTGTR